MVGRVSGDVASTAVKQSKERVLVFIKFGTSVVPFRGRDIPDYHSSKAGVVRLRTEVFPGFGADAVLYKADLACAHAILFRSALQRKKL